MYVLIELNFLSSQNRPIAMASRTSVEATSPSDGPTNNEEAA